MVKTLLTGLLFSLIGTAAADELSCAPSGGASVVSGHLSNPHFGAVESEWRKTTASRYLEGGGKDCKGPDMAVPGYEGLPVSECRYRSNGADGNSPWPALGASVRLLNPSARLLTLWTINACSLNGATGYRVKSCADEMIKRVQEQNGAQYPVSGVVIERECDSSLDPEKACDRHPTSHVVHAPRNIPFQHGVSVDTNAMTIWSKNDLTKTDEAMFAKLFRETDADVVRAYRYSRVAGATREEWKSWREAKGQPLAPSGVIQPNFNPLTSHRDWLAVSREVHKAACKSDNHELFNAVVFAKGWAK